MKHILFIASVFLSLCTQAQQINPVPDYIFRNQMSVGRNGVTDTAAYMSVGPRFGAVKGFMPPMVTDTNSVTGVKRNGLLIFSLQLNNFAYWDSTTARFRKITAEATVDSLIYATRAWRQKGDDSLGAIIAVKTDTGLISTRAYRQKGIDSVVTLISTLGGGTVLSVSAGTGMNFPTITTSGAVNADTLVLSTRAWRQKAVDSVGAIVGTKVNISDTATMLGAYLRKVDTTAMLTPYLRKVDTTAMLTPYVRAAGFGLVKSTYTLSADTAAMATRARVQKGIDSVAGLFTSPDTLTLSTRAWRQKGDDSLGAIIGTKATATGTTNYLSKFTGTSALGNSIVYGTTNEIGISTSTPSEKLDVNGRVRVRTIDSTGTGINMLYSDADGVIKKAAIPAGGSGTVTSVATGYGLSGGTITTTGTLIVDTSAIATRSRVQKGIDSVASVRIGGTGTTNYVPKWSGTNTQAISQIFDNGTNVGIANTNPLEKFVVNGNVGLSGNSGASRRIFLNLETNTYTGTLQMQAGGGSAGFGGGLTMYGHSHATRPGYVTAGISSGSSGRFTVNNQGLGGGDDIFSVFQNGDVAIGNTSPSYKLDVTGTLRNTTGAAFATSSGNVLVGKTVDAGVKLDVVGSIANTTGANFATSSGNVGIKNTNPAFPLDINTTTSRVQFRDGASTGGTASGSGIVSLTSDLTALSAMNNRALLHTFIVGSNEVVRINGAEQLLIGTAADDGYKLNLYGNFRNTTGANLATSSGNVGIGTTSPVNYGAGFTGLTINGSTGGVLTLRNNAVTFWELYTNGSDVRVEFPVTSNYVWRASNGTERARITTDGYLGINTNAPTQYLDVNGRARIRTIDSTGTGTAMNILYADATGVIKKAAVPSGGGGSVTSITAGTGLTGGTITTSGTIAVDTASIATRARVQKGIDSVTTLANTKLSGTGIAGYFPKWTGSTTQDTSQLFQLGRNIGIGTATPTYRIHLPDAGNVNAQAMIAGTVLGSDGNGQTIRPSNSLAMALFGQADIGYIYGAAVSSTGRWGINTRSLNDATFNVDGSVKIVTIDSTSTARNMLYQDANGVIKKSAVPTGSGTITTSEANISENYTVTSTDHFVFLPALEGAGRNIILPNDAVNGRQLIFFNTSNDGSHRWTFTNEDVENTAAAPVTTLTNRTTYTMVYYAGKFRIISTD